MLSTIVIKHRFKQLKTALPASLNRLSRDVKKTSNHILTDYLCPYLADYRHLAEQFKAQHQVYAKK
ncbi:MAG: hypothetical protein ABUK13_03770 [Gammaproteobacteria bacterium]